MLTVEGEIEQISASLGIPYPNPPGYSDCAWLTVAWNEAKRMPALLKLAKHWFTRTVVVVQTSTDSTSSIVRKAARKSDQVIDDAHHGFGDASMPALVRAAGTPWSFVVAADEVPSEELLQSLWTATAYADRVRADGIWVPFKSTVDGIGSKDTQSGHLRLFRSQLGWPGTMHSRPPAKRELWWPFGHIQHDRSLDEMMQDYLRIYDLGKTQPGWVAHNTLMMHDACAGVAAEKGWKYVQQHEWWPKVLAIAFNGQDPA